MPRDLKSHYCCGVFHNGNTNTNTDTVTNAILFNTTVYQRPVMKNDTYCVSYLPEKLIIVRSKHVADRLM